MNKAFKVLDVKINALEIQEVLQIVDSWISSKERKSAKYICVTNVNSVVAAQKDPYLKQITNQSDISVCDGMPLFWLSKIKGFKAKDRVAGTTLMEKTLEFSQEKGYSSYFYGSTEHELKRLLLKTKEKYPRLKIAGSYSPPFKPLTPEEKKGVIENINNSDADFVWVGLGYPKQEIWMYEFKDHLKASVLIGVGAAFDFFSGKKKRAPFWMRKLGLEWIFRFLCEPKRLWRRYIINNTLFIILLMKERMAACQRPKCL